MTPMVKSRPFKPPKESTIAYIGLGANLGERENTIEEALRRIEADDRTSLLRSTVPIETDPVGATEALEEIERQIRDDLRRIRELLFEMTSEDPPATEPALAALVRDLGVRWHFPVMVEVGGDLEGIEEPVLEAVYAIVSEALANAAKHSGAPEAHVRVKATATEIRVEIEDRGRGIVAVKDDDPHFGVPIMRARAEKLGGSLDVGSTPGRGTTVVAVLPYQRAGG